MTHLPVFRQLHGFPSHASEGGHNPLIQLRYILYKSICETPFSFWFLVSLNPIYPNRKYIRDKLPENRKTRVEFTKTRHTTDIYKSTRLSRAITMGITSVSLEMGPLHSYENNTFTIYP